MSRTKAQQEAFDKAERAARKDLEEPQERPESEAPKRTKAQQAQFDAAEAVNRENGAREATDGDIELEVDNIKVSSTTRLEE